MSISIRFITFYCFNFSKNRYFTFFIELLQTVFQTPHSAKSLSLKRTVSIEALAMTSSVTLSKSIFGISID